MQPAELLWISEPKETIVPKGRDFSNSGKIKQQIIKILMFLQQGIKVAEGHSTDILENVSRMVLEDLHDWSLSFKEPREWEMIPGKTRTYLGFVEHMEPAALLSSSHTPSVWCPLKTSKETPFHHIGILQFEVCLIFFFSAMKVLPEHSWRKPETQ